MNRLLVHYCVDVRHPEVSGAEHLEMLRIRDKLADIESTLTLEEQLKLAEADRALVVQAVTFSQELLRFLDLAEYRLAHRIPPERWWWYLDVVRYVPCREPVTPTPEQAE
jgi:hypothetical protein